MLAFYLVLLVVVAVAAFDDNDANTTTVDWAFMGTEYWSRNESGALVEQSRFDEKSVLEYVKRNSAPELSDVLALNFKRPKSWNVWDKAYVDDVMGDRACPYQIRAVSFSLKVSQNKWIKT